MKNALPVCKRPTYINSKATHRFKRSILNLHVFQTWLDMQSVPFVSESDDGGRLITCRETYLPGIQVPSLAVSNPLQRLIHSVVLLHTPIDMRL